MITRKLIERAAAVFTLAFAVVLVQVAEAKSEADYTNEFCPAEAQGIVLDDGTKPDCAAWGYVIEVDWAKGKWYDGIGQALHYSNMSGKAPALVLLVKEESWCEYAYRAWSVGLRNKPMIQVFVYGEAAAECKIEMMPKVVQ